MENHVVIMAGGVGSRFWPISTPEYPKQFVDVLGYGKTMIQMTVERFQGICPMSNFWVVTSADYVDIVRAQLPELPRMIFSACKSVDAKHQQTPALSEDGGHYRSIVVGGAVLGN